MKKTIFFLSVVLILGILCNVIAIAAAGTITIDSYDNTTDRLYFSWDYIGANNTAFLVYADGSVLSEKYYFTSFVITKYSESEYTNLYVSEDSKLPSAYTASIIINPNNYIPVVTYENYFNDVIIISIGLIIAFSILAWSIWYFSLPALVLQVYVFTYTIEISNDYRLLIISGLITIAILFNTFLSLNKGDI